MCSYGDFMTFDCLLLCLFLRFIYSHEQKFKTTQFFKRKIIVLSTNHFKIISICLTIILLI